MTTPNQKIKSYMIGILILFALALAVGLWRSVHETNKWIDFIQKERMGMEYNNYLRKLLKDLLHHRGMTNAYLSGDPSFKDDIATEHSMIVDDIKGIDSITARYGRQLKVDDKWEAFKKSWKELEYTEYSLTPKEFFDGHTALIAGVISLISYVGESSNLILDPEIASYYLMDFITYKSPILVENIGQARGIGIRTVVTRNLSADEKLQLIILSGIIRSYYAEAGKLTQKVFSAKPELKPEMEGIVGEFDADIKAFLNTLDREIINARKIAIRPADYYAAATKVIDTGFRLSDKKSIALAEILDGRIYKYRGARALVVSIATVISAIFVYTLLLLRKSLTRVDIAQEALRHRLEFERIISDTSSSFINHRETGIDTKIDTALQKIGEFVGASHSFVSFFSKDGTMLEDVHEWHPQGVLPRKGEWKGMPVDKLPWSIGRLKNLGSVSIPNVEALPPEAMPEREILKAQGLVSVCLVPMIRQGETVGLLGYTAVREPRIWTEIDVSLLKTVGEIILNAMERQRAKENLMILSITDPLTKIYNRLKLNDTLEFEINRYMRFNRPFSIIMFDIDHFKEINDRLGHQAGDEVLKELTQEIAKQIRATDTFARWGGEEFMILVVESPIDGATAFAEKLRKEIEVSCFCSVGRLTCSFGVTEFMEGDSINSLTKRVDEALYEAKSSGRNRVCVR